MATSQTDHIRILLVDDHAVMRMGLRMLIESHPDFEVVGEADNRRDALAAVTAQQPDIVLLDIDLGSDNGLDMIPELLAAAPGVGVIMLTGLRDPEAHARAVRLGANGVVLKEQASDNVIEAITRVHSGQAWLDPALTARVLRGMGSAPRPAKRDPEAAKIAQLTQRELEVIALLAEGLQNKDVSERLHITENTVRRHLATIFDKLGVETRLELVIYAFRHGLAKPPG